MDIISMGAATKAGMEEAKTRKQTLEIGVAGSQASVAKRLEVLEASYLSGVKKANELIVKDTINIMKAYQRLNTISLSKRYKMENMIYDDLLDLSGIDTAKSLNYAHNSTSGTLKKSGTSPMVIETIKEQLASDAKSVLVSIDAMTDNASSGQTNVARGATVTAVKGPIEFITEVTNGVKTTSGSSGFARGAAGTEIEVDLGKSFNIGQIRLTQYYADSRNYIDVLVRASDDKKSWTTLLDTKASGTYVETASGKLIDAQNMKMRYIRFYANGNNTNAYNHWVEVEAYEAVINRPIPAKDLVLTLYASRDSGLTWQEVKVEQLTTFDDTISKKDGSLKLRMLVGDNQLLNGYSLLWI